MAIELKIGKLTAEKVTKLDEAMIEMFGDSGLKPPYYVIREGKEFLFEVKTMEDAAGIFGKIVGRKAQEYFQANVEKR